MPERIIVRGNTLIYRQNAYPCAVGKGGLIEAEAKREGDGCTPIGAWPLRECWWRPDRISAPATALSLHPITPEDAWCDDPAHPWYNRHFRLPAKPHGEFSPPRSYENLWREDVAYDLIVPLGYNDDPVLPGRGSAIFLHCAKDGYPPTEGCVAVARGDLLALLPKLGKETMLEVHADESGKTIRIIPLPPL